tara:strand:+ start:1791 stop:2375 length:585 start_codon:yes stop_codon:yes gene_type:complete
MHKIKCFIISQPKAGTYLCANILKELGFHFHNNHFSEKHFAIYPPVGSPELAVKLQHPHRARVRHVLQQSLPRIKSGQVGVGHLIYKHDTEKRLRKFYKIVLTRDKKDILASMERWTKFSKRPPANLNAVLDTADRILPWISRQGVFHMTFNDMKNMNLDKINKLQSFLRIYHSLGSETLIKRALAEPSITKVI